MASYRFCRPDNIPYLVQAVNECYRVHFPETPEMTVEGFRSEMKHLGVWPSNSMVAVGADGPVAVMIGTKRPREVLILRVGVHPEHLRQGHGSHILTSLSHKLAVLGPERLIAEIPRSMPEVARFFEAVGYRREVTYTDYLRPPGPVEPVPAELFVPAGVDELLEHGLLPTDDGHEVAWERARETLVGSQDVLAGVAFATPVGLEAFLLYRAPAADAETIDVVAAGGHESEQRELYLSLLLRHLAGGGRALRIPKLADGELSPAVLSALGFEPGERFDRYASSAVPA